MAVDLPETWKFLGGMWWILHVIAILLVFFAGFLIGKYSSEPEPDPVDQDELRRLEEEKKSSQKSL